MGRTKGQTAQPITRNSTHLDPTLLIPTGCTLLNLALSDTPYGGAGLGRITHIVGDSSAGKTFLGYSMFAECSHRKRFDRYALYDDDVEAANAFDVEKLFGRRTAARVQPPPNGCSNTVQDFLLTIKQLLDEERPFIYLLDSFDALTSDEDTDKVNELADARRKGIKEKGTYGMQKPKIASQFFRMMKKRLKDTASAVIILSQTRDDINPMTFSTKTHSGGRALKFYASHQLWLAVGKKHKRRNLTVGIDCVAKITKNKMTGKIREVTFPIYYSYGIDDIRTNIDFLLAEGAATKRGNRIELPCIGEGGEAYSTDKWIKTIDERRDLQKQLQKAVGRAWAEREHVLDLGRKARYA